MQRDTIHWAVRDALEKNDWTIIADPFSLKSGGVWIHADLAAEKMLMAQKENTQIVIEIKSFGKNSLMNNFHEAMGQYIDYRGALEDEGLKMKLYLAISEETWLRLNKFPFYISRLNQNKVHLIIVDIQAQNIIKWIH